jgi:hypothetical protein
MRSQVEGLLEWLGDQHIHQHNHAQSQDEERKLLDFQVVFASCRVDCHIVFLSVQQAGPLDNGSTVGGTTVTYLKFLGSRFDLKSPL